MKKILFFVVVAVAFASCSEKATNENAYYFDEVVSRLYNDPNAEMDTLSYAAGMNVGLVILVQNADFELDTEAIIKLLDKELKKVNSDPEQMEKVDEYLSSYASEIVGPYMRAKQMNSRIETDRPDTLQMPELFNETYTREKFASMLVLATADGMRKQSLPVNLHWVYQAIRDAANVNDKSGIDSVMAISELEFKNTLRDYMQYELPIYTADCTNAWFQRVAVKSDVKAMTDANGVETGVYYRINKAGGEPKPVNATDSITVKYQVYSRTGKLLESDELYIKNLEKKRSQIEKNTMLPLQIRETYIDQINTQIANSDPRILPLNTFMQKHVQEALKLVGKGGSITIWMDANKAFGPNAGKILPINDAVVINVELVDVETVMPTFKPVQNVVLPEKGSIKNKVAPAQGGASQKLSTPTIVPVQK